MCVVDMGIQWRPEVRHGGHGGLGDVPGFLHVVVAGVVVVVVVFLFFFLAAPFTCRDCRRILGPAPGNAPRSTPAPTAARRRPNVALLPTCEENSR